MKYTGIICDGCGREFTENDDVVVCPVCGTPQHRECWNRENNCVNASRHAEDFSWTVPAWKKKEEENEKAEQKKEEEKSRGAGLPGDIPDSIRFRNGEGAVRCPECGAINFENDKVCARCGKFLKPEQPAGDPAFDGPEMQYNGFDVIRLFGGLDANAMIDDIPVNEISSYIGGKRPGKFIRRFAMMDRSGKNISFNPAVILFGPLWYFYRKMPKIGVLFLAVVALISVVGTVATTDEPTKKYYAAQGEIVTEFATGKITREQMNEQISEIYNAYSETDTDTWRKVVSYVCDGANIALYLFMVMKADAFYRKKIKRDVETIRARNNNMTSYRIDLAQTGGPSAVLAVAGVFVAFLTMLIGELPAYYYIYFG